MAETFTSLEISKFLGRNHNKVLRDIKSLIERDIGYTGDVLWGEYKNSRGKLYPLATLSGELLEVFKLKHLYGVTIKNRKVREDTALSTIEQLMRVKLEREYMVNVNNKIYRLDGYDMENNIAYEIDDSYHFINGELRVECVKRQEDIESYLGCKFVRIKV